MGSGTSVYPACFLHKPL
jgi:hypothetical protein